MTDGTGYDEDERRVVLIADADLSIRSLVKLTLNSDRTTVIEAADADEAVALVEMHDPDVAFLDRALPGGGGTAAAERIKEAAGGVRCVLLVPKREIDEVHDDAGILDGLLTKPFTSLALLRKVDDDAT